MVWKKFRKYAGILGTICLWKLFSLIRRGKFENLLKRSPFLKRYVKPWHGALKIIPKTHPKVIYRKELFHILTFRLRIVCWTPSIHCQKMFGACILPNAGWISTMKRFYTPENYPNHLDPLPHVVWCCLIIFQVGLQHVCCPCLWLVLNRNEPFLAHAHEREVCGIYNYLYIKAPTQKKNMSRI